MRTVSVQQGNIISMIEYFFGGEGKNTGKSPFGEKNKYIFQHENSVKQGVISMVGYLFGERVKKISLKRQK